MASTDTIEIYKKENTLRVKSQKTDGFVNLDQLDEQSIDIIYIVFTHSRAKSVRKFPLIPLPNNSKHVRHVNLEEKLDTIQKNIEEILFENCINKINLLVLANGVRVFLEKGLF